MFFLLCPRVASVVVVALFILLEVQDLDNVVEARSREA